MAYWAERVQLFGIQQDKLCRRLPASAGRPGSWKAAASTCRTPGQEAAPCQLPADRRQRYKPLFLTYKTARCNRCRPAGTCFAAATQQHHRLSDQQGLGHCSHDAQSGSATVAQPADAWHGRPHHAQAGVTTAQPASAWVTVRHCVPCTAFQAAQTNRLCRCAQTSDIIPSCNRHHTQLVGRPNSCGFTAALSPQAAPTWRPSRRRGVAQSTPASGWANMTEQPGVGRAAACATSVGQDMRSMHPMPCVGPEAAHTNRAAC